MKKNITMVLIFFFSLFFHVRADISFLNEGLTENQAYNIRIYTLRSLNLVLDAYSSLSKKRVIKKETYAYLDASLFFLNEAYQYSPSYMVRREIEALEKRIKHYPEEDYTTDIRVLTVHIEEISASLKDYFQIKDMLNILLENAGKRKNDLLLEGLKEVKEKVKLPMIDDPISEARFLIGVAKDHLKAREYKKSKQALELALTPLIKISLRENLYIALSKEYIYKAKFSYKVSFDMSKRYLMSALYNVNKAYLVSSEENREKLKTLKNKLNFYLQKYESFSITQEDFDDLIKLINSI